MADQDPGVPPADGQNTHPHDQTVDLRSPASPAVAPAAAVPPQAAPAPADMPPAGRQAAPQTASNDEIRWTANEFAAHDKPSSWYAILAVVAIAAAAIAYFVFDIVTSIVIMLCAGLFGYVAGRQPRQQQYGVDDHAIHIGAKTYPYTSFNGFAVIEEGPASSIDFMPLKRFSPIITMPYDPSDEPRVLEIISRHLPYANHKRTMTDDLMHRIGF